MAYIRNFNDLLFKENFFWAILSIIEIQIPNGLLNFKVAWNLFW